MNSDLQWLAHKASLATAFFILVTIVAVNGEEVIVLLFWAVLFAAVATVLRLLAK